MTLLTKGLLKDHGILDPRFGPLLRVDMVRLGKPEPAWWLSHVSLSRTPPGAPFSSNTVASAGTSIARGDAEQRALGEALERYSALTAEVGDRRLRPRDVTPGMQFPRCASDEDCPNSLRSTPPTDTKLTYVEVRKLADGAPLLIPAGYVHLNFWPSGDEPLVALPISTGVAFRQSLAEALWNALCEVAERDALMLTWWLRAPVREVIAPITDAPRSLADRLSAIARSGLEARLFDITTDFRVPTIFCILFGSSYPRVSVGASCKSDPVDALCKALDEAVAGRIFLRNNTKPHHEHDPQGIPRSLEDHAFYYADGRNSAAFEFLTQGSKPLPFRDYLLERDWWSAPVGTTELAALATRLHELGLTVLWTDITAPEVSAFGRVVKVVVPEMIPLSSDHSIRWLATPRLVDRGGIRDIASTVFNPYPHPFA